MVLYLMILLVYYPRSRGNLNMGFVRLYLVLCSAALLSGWALIRRWDVHPITLLLIQLGLFLHDIGGMNLFGERTYSLFILGIGYDKYVHFYNSMAGVFALELTLVKLNADFSKLKLPILALVVMGAGAIIEVIEYIGVRTLPSPASPWHYAIPLVELYDNNLQDMIANLTGCVCGAGLLGVFYKVHALKSPNKSKLLYP